MVMIILCINGLNYGMIAPFMPNYTLDKGLTQSWVGIFLGAQILSTVFHTLMCPMYVRYSSNLTVLAIGSVLSTVGILSTGFIAPLASGTAFGALVILFRLLTGLGDGLLQTAGLAYILRAVVQSVSVTLLLSIEYSVRRVAHYYRQLSVLCHRQLWFGWVICGYVVLLTQTNS